MQVKYFYKRATYIKKNVLIAGAFKTEKKHANSGGPVTWFNIMFNP